MFPWSAEVSLITETTHSGCFAHNDMHFLFVSTSCGPGKWAKGIVYLYDNRIVLQADIMTPSEFMFRELNWLPFYKRVNYHKCVLMYKSLNNIAPDYLTERFMKVSETHNRQLRSADNDLLKVPFSRTKYYDNSFTVSGAKLWNSLPLNIRQSPSIDSFKCSIKAHLLETNSQWCHGGCP